MERTPPPENLNLFISKHKRINWFDVEEPTLEVSVDPSSVLDDEIEDAAEVGSEVRGVLWAVAVIGAKLAIFGVDLLAYDEGTVALLVCIADELSFVVASVAVAGALLFASRAARELAEVAEFGESLDGPVEHAWKLLLLDFSFKVGVLAVGIAEFDVERDDADAVPDTVGAVGKGWEGVGGEEAA